MLLFCSKTRNQIPKCVFLPPLDILSICSIQYYRPKVGLMLGRRRRRRTNIKPTLGQRKVVVHQVQCLYYLTNARRWVSIGPTLLIAGPALSRRLVSGDVLPLCSYMARSRNYDTFGSYT